VLWKRRVGISSFDVVVLCYKIYDGKSRELQLLEQHTSNATVYTINSHVANEDLTHGMKLNACLLNSNVADGVLLTTAQMENPLY
jgi:hypothetical protein